MKKSILTVGLFILIHVTLKAQTANSVPSSGNVGLGTTSPSTKLQVCGDVKIDSSLTVKEDVQAKSDLKVDGDVYLGGDLYFTIPLSTSIIFDKIGVIDPNGQFRGVTRAGLAAALYEETCIPFTDGTNTYFNAPAWQSFGGPNLNDPKLITGIDCPARVGIGVQDPLTILAVNGTASFSQNVGIGSTNVGSARLTVTTTVPTQMAMQVVATNTQTDGYAILSTVGKDETKAFAAERSDTGEDVFRVWGDGRVEAKSLRLSLNIWSDHVFGDDYKLIPLEEVNEIITKENHLPGVPTEKEVKEKGIDVGNNDAMLLEKVEEAYLYLIQLNEKYKKLQEDYDKLKAEFELLKK